MADGRERQVSGHQRLAVRRQLPQKTDPDAGCLLGVVFEAVVPVGMLEPDLEHGVAGERQPVVAGSSGVHNLCPVQPLLSRDSTGLRRALSVLHFDHHPHA